MQHRVFTTRYGGRERVLRNDVGIHLPISADEVASLDGKTVRKYSAIWDTGATNSGITKKVVDDLGLKPTGLVEVSHAKGRSMTNTYLVNIYLPSEVTIGQVRVTEVELLSDNLPEGKRPQILVGMDVIGMGDFAVTNFSGKTVMSFRIPSVEEIDFIPRAQENNVMEGGNRQARRAMEAKKRKGFL